MAQDWISGNVACTTQATVYKPQYLQMANKFKRYILLTQLSFKA